MTSVENAQSDAQFNNFFVLFEQPVQFKLSQESLDYRLRMLQKRYHPDNIAKMNTNTVDMSVDSQSLHLQSEQDSALINQAYQTLSNPDSRATYMLEMRDQAQTLDHSIADLEFLGDAMELRIELEEAIEDKTHLTLQQLHPQITTRLTNQSIRFDEAYQQQDWQTAIDATQKLKFLVKLNADITTALDELATATQADDDDLYV